MDVLIVEDDDAMAGALTAAVESAGHHPQRLSRGADALLSHRNFQVILLDLGLPDMDGHVVARAIRALNPAPLLFLTARSESDDVLAGMASGADGYLTKPFRPGELKELARQLVASTPPPQQTVSLEQTTAGETST